jgi:periplasmic protein TonB
MTTDLRPVYARPMPVAVAVVLLHAGGLYALQSGLLRRAVELVIPAEMISQIVEPPQPLAPPPVPQPKPAPTPAPTAPKTTSSKPPSAAQPLAVRDATPSPNAPQGASTPAPPAPTVEAAPAPATAPAAAPVQAAAPAKVELPSSDADYLNNPPPAYPPVSRRLGETGKVVVRVFIGIDGTAQKGEVRTSSGFERLDTAALAAALKWRYSPGKRAGAAEAMWVNVPINFTLN